jgi:hypothetical protein
MNGESIAARYLSGRYATGDKARQQALHHVPGCFWLEQDTALWHEIAMTKRSSNAGGFFLFLGVVTGLAWGIARGAVMPGIIIGTAAGAAVAVVLWLVDRRR